MTPGKRDIHQRVAERIDKALWGNALETGEPKNDSAITAAILEEEYGPIIKALLASRPLSKKGLL